MGEAKDGGNINETADVAVVHDDAECNNLNNKLTKLCKSSSPSWDSSSKEEEKDEVAKKLIFDEIDSIEPTNSAEEANAVDDDPEDGFVSVDISELSLNQAVKTGNYQLVQKILTSQPTADVNMRDEENNSCLHEACIHNCQFTKIAELLLQHGADPNIKDNLGETPLHGSVLFHYTDNVRLLCEYKADFNMPNNDGVTPLDIAVFVRDLEVLEIFGRPLPSGKKIRGACGKGSLRKSLQRSVLRPRNMEDLNYIPSPLSSPSILKKRKRVADDDDEADSPLAKKSISFSGKDRYSPSSLYH